MDSSEDAQLELGEAWRAGLAAGVAKRMRERRLAVGLSVQRVADICTRDYGLPMKRSVLANFEGGRRPALSVAELLVIARILGITPLDLLFPVGTEPDTEVLPGIREETWEAAKWFTGESDVIPGLRGAADPRSEAQAVQLFRAHDRLIESWGAQQRFNMTAMQDRAAAGGTPDATFFEGMAKALADLEASIREVRQKIRSVGLTPPSLPTGLALSEETRQFADTPAGRELNKYAPRTDGEK
ncbi:helix-turn-helix domain-containing protein [Streptomyces halstedii]|uniref:helix-turn-helix domain-containing protein n=1 Tax=Streptomyces halstedii TaxID=1944 RepID=UPI0038109353